MMFIIDLNEALLQTVTGALCFDNNSAKSSRSEQSSNGLDASHKSQITTLAPAA